MTIRWRVPIFAAWAVLCTVPAEARTLTLRCEGRFAYILTYDTDRRRLAITVEGMKRLLKIRRVQDDEDGLLIWASTPAFGGDRDMLVRIGREKWVRTWFRNGSEETIGCRSI